MDREETRRRLLELCDRLALRTGATVSHTERQLLLALRELAALDEGHLLDQLGHRIANPSRD